jgi:hypothetical protein
MSKEIWNKLSAVDCSKHIEKKGNLSYLSWAWAWGTLMEHYPDATYEFHEPTIYEGGTMEVRCTVTIEGLSRTMWLPVMDYKNQAIVNPDARAISDNKMRCLVKAIAMFGLGHYIYAGEDIPGPPPTKPERPKNLGVEQRAAIEHYIMGGVIPPDKAKKMRAGWDVMTTDQANDIIEWCKKQERKQ